MLSDFVWVMKIQAFQKQIFVSIRLFRIPRTSMYSSPALILLRPSSSRKPPTLNPSVLFNPLAAPVVNTKPCAQGVNQQATTEAKRTANTIVTSLLPRADSMSVEGGSDEEVEDVLPWTFPSPNRREWEAWKRASGVLTNGICMIGKASPTAGDLLVREAREDRLLVIRPAPS
jgi:hypothetical protein